MDQQTRNAVLDLLSEARSSIDEISLYLDPGDERRADVEVLLADVEDLTEAFDLERPDR